MSSSDHDPADDLLDRPFDVLGSALHSHETVEEAIRTKLDFIIYLLNLDTQATGSDLKSRGFSSFINFRCMEIASVFSDVVTYISQNVKLTWDKCDGDDEWEINASGTAKELYHIVDDAIDDAFQTKGALFQAHADLGREMFDIWFNFLEDHEIAI